MHLHRIEIENLGSLYGTQAIDFDRDLQDAPLFLIQGPTGAGKSTILDAVSLALFGQTPRLDDTAATATDDLGDENVRNIMSRGTGASRVHLVFSRASNEGRRYFAAEWRCRRAHGRADGRVQTPERMLRELQANFEEDPQGLYVDSSKSKEWAPVFEEALDGLTAEDFRRCMLLAQGEFSAFLRADDDARAAILERLTDSQEYRTIGLRAAEQKRRAQQAYDELTARLQDAMPPSDEEIAEKRRDRAQFMENAEKAHKKTEQIRGKEKWLTRSKELKRAHEEANTRLQQSETALAENKERFEALRQHLALQPWFAIDDEVQAWEAAADSRESEHARLREKQRNVSEALQRAKTVRDEEAAKVQQFSVTRSEGLEEIQRSRTAWKKADEDKVLCAGLREQMLASTQRLEKASEACTRLRHEREKQVETLEALKLEGRALDELTPHVESVEGFARALDRLRDQRIVAINHADKLDALKRERVPIGNETRDAQALAKQTRQEVDTLRAKLAREHSTRSDEERLQNGKREARLQEMEHALSALRDALRQRVTLTESLHEVHREASQLREEAQQKNQELERASAAKKELDVELKRLHETLRDKEELVDQAALIVSLLEHRASLKPGDECPLCGAKDHPAADRDDEEARERHRVLLDERGTIRASITETQDRDNVLRETIARLQTERNARQRRLDELMTRQQSLEAKLEACREQGKAAYGCFLPPGSSDEQAPRFEAHWSEATGHEAGTLPGLGLDAKPDALSTYATDALESARAAKKAEEALEHELEKAELRNHSANERLEKAVRAQSELEERVKAADAQHKELQQAYIEAHQSLADELKDTPWARAFEALEPTPTQFRAFVAQLQADEKAVKRHQQALRDAEHALQSTQSSLTNAEEQHRLEASAHDALKRRMESASTEAESSLSAARSTLGGVHPDEALRNLDAKHEALRKSLAASEARVNELEKAHQLAAQELATHLARVDEQAQRITQLREEATTLLRAGSAEGETLTAEQARARRLDPERLEAWQRRQQELTREHERRSVVSEQARDALSAHLAAAPSWSDEERAIESDALLETLQTQLQTSQEEERNLQQQVGATTSWLEQAEVRIARCGELRAELQEAERNLRIWRDIHELIGASDGQAFQRFAQALNLEALLEDANHHLRTLAPRYRFVVKRDSESGLPTLDFAVSDRDHAGEERPLSTLSGGETFLASLALALGLASRRRLRLHMETLLLDEGFGTLDPNALDTAITTLEQLQTRGVRVGIISHVGELRERIHAQIEVQPGNAGRSRIVVHGAGR